MRHPAEYWIRFLLTRRHPIEEIQGMCELADLGAARTEYILNLESEMNDAMPMPFRPRLLSDRASQVFLRRQGIYEMWHPTVSMMEAEELLGNSPARALLETFILSPLKPDQAVRQINAKIGQNLTVRAYELFKHFYWNNELLSGAEWGAYIRARNVAHRDWLKCAVTARGPQGVQLILWKTGSGAMRHIDSGKMFTDIRNISYMKIKETEYQPASSDHAKMMLNYARVAKMSQEEITSSAQSMQDVVKSFQAFKMRNETQEIPTVQQLTGGVVSEAEDSGGVEERFDY